MNTELKIEKNSLKEIFIIFLKLGFTAFGGPAAHIALMEDELVTKRKWMERQKYLDIIGLTNLLPGPNSTEVAIMMGYLRGGIAGLFTAGIAFIAPAMIIVTILAYLYVTFGSLPQISSIMNGITPVVSAIILIALIKFYKTAVKDTKDIILFILATVCAFFGINELFLLFTFGIIFLLLYWFKTNKAGTNSSTKINSIIPIPFLVLITTGANNIGMAIQDLFLTFLKIGSVLYGSGYVLIAFIEREFVSGRGILTMKELMDSVSIGQFTPGPVFTTATFIGYILGGLPGSFAATIGIFLPSFILVWLLKPILFKMSSSKILRQVLNGINIASLGLMAAVLVNFGRNSIGNIPSAILFLASVFILLKTKVNSAILIVLGGIIGFLLSHF